MTPLSWFDPGRLAPDRALLHDCVNLFCAVTGHLNKRVRIEDPYCPDGLTWDTRFTGNCTNNVLWGDIMVAAETQKEPYHTGFCSGIAEINRGTAVLVGIRTLFHTHFQKSSGDFKRGKIAFLFDHPCILLNTAFSDSLVDLVDYRPGP